MLNEDKNLLVQIAQNLLAVNSLKPYVGWENFKTLIENNYRLYKEIVSSQEPERMSLRYINKVNVGTVHSYENIKNYFDFTPQLPFEFSGYANSIQNICEFPFPEFESFLAIQQVTLRPEKEMTAPVLFEISFTRTSNKKEIDLLDWLEFAHEKIKHVFDSSFTQSAKNQFSI